jgi:hypothetical protein
MGLYDTIHIPKKFLPLTRKEEENLESENFQTKSLGEKLLRFRVNEDKFFEINWKSDFTKNIEEDTWEIIYCTNAITFSAYLLNSKKAIDLVAIVDNGELESIKRIVSIDEAINKQK